MTNAYLYHPQLYNNKREMVVLGAYAMDEKKRTNRNRPDQVHTEHAPPKGLSIETNGSELVITRTWFQWSHVFFIVIFLIPIGLPLLNIVFSTLSGRPSSPFVLVFFCVPFLPLNYIGLAFIFNKTIITINATSITTQHRPFPWFDSKCIPTAHIKDIYTTQQTFHGGEDGTSSHTYGVEVLLQDGTKKVVVRVSDPFTDWSQHMWYIKDEIQRYVRI